MLKNLTIRAFIALLLLGVWGCATTKAADSVSDDDNFAMIQSSSKGKQKKEKKKIRLLAKRKSDKRTVINRPALCELVKKGAQPFIRRVSVRPAFKARRFYGWRVLSYSGPGKVRVGDIIMRINNKTIEKPKEVMDVWDSLCKAKSFKVDLFREGKVERFDIPIVPEQS